ncbi:MAG TPA: hypothetical protein V6C64_15245 [Microcoleaceae cyanobacterium]|jgi:hypothetical protein
MLKLLLIVGIVLGLASASLPILGVSPVYAGGHEGLPGRRVGGGTR